MFEALSEKPKPHQSGTPNIDRLQRFALGPSTSNPLSGYRMRGTIVVEQHPREAPRSYTRANYRQSQGEWGALPPTPRLRELPNK